MKKETRGGARANSGRKPITDKKMQLSIYLRKSKIDLNGGSEAIKEKIYKILKSKK
jgi:hypothetical protein